MKIVNVGEALILQVLIDNLLDDAVVRLYQNALTPTPETVLEDLVEADYSGYTADDGDLAALGNVWGAPALADDGRFTTTGDTNVEHVRGAGATNNTIYGVYATSAAGELIYVHRLVDGFGNPTSFAMNVEGATLRITPKFSFQSREEISGGPIPVAAQVATDGEHFSVFFDRAITGTTGFALLIGPEANLTFDGQAAALQIDFAIDRVITSDEFLALQYTPGDVVETSTGAPFRAITMSVVNASEVAP